MKLLSLQITFSFATTECLIFCIDAAKNIDSCVFRKLPANYYSINTCFYKYQKDSCLPKQLSTKFFINISEKLKIYNREVTYSMYFIERLQLKEKKLRKEEGFSSADVSAIRLLSSYFHEIGLD
jgi:hypothetical protein